jgi:hypothetical protein
MARIVLLWTGTPVSGETNKSQEEAIEKRENADTFGVNPYSVMYNISVFV